MNESKDKKSDNMSEKSDKNGEGIKNAHLFHFSGDVIEWKTQNRHILPPQFTSLTAHIRVNRIVDHIINININMYTKTIQYCNTILQHYYSPTITVQ